MSRPIVVIVCMVSSSESWEPQQRPHPWPSRAGGGGVHSIRNGRWRKITNHWRATTRPARIALLRRGLSLSYDVVVKQHGGSIEVDTHPREFTEFKVILPRIAATSKAGADK